MAENKNFGLGINEIKEQIPGQSTKKGKGSPYYVPDFDAYDTPYKPFQTATGFESAYAQYHKGDTNKTNKLYPESESETKTEPLAEKIYTTVDGKYLDPDDPNYFKYDVDEFEGGRRLRRKTRKVSRRKRSTKKGGKRKATKSRKGKSRKGKGKSRRH